MGRRALLVATLLSCTPKAETPTSAQEPTPSTGDTAEVCLGDEVEGTWSPDWDYCHQSEPLLELCNRLNWWDGEGCPSFAEASLHYLSISDYEWETSARRCANPGPSFYDVLSFAPLSDVNDGDVAIFDDDGQMLGFVDLEFGAGLPNNCCQGHVVKGRSWGEQLDIGCDDYTTIPLSFPDTAYTADTGTL